MKKAAFQKEFESPGAEFRGAPFWSWNAKLDQTELRRQVHVLHEMGMGGFFMHSRVGLDTVFLSDEWMDCVRASVEEADKLGMRAWLYDEDRWPSGTAGGMVTKNLEFRSRGLVMETAGNSGDVPWDDDLLAVFLAEINEDDALGAYREVDREGCPRQLGANERLLVFRVKLDSPRAWYNGSTYLDTMNHQAVQAFIETAYEPYKQRFAHEFGKRIPGIFTDEPSYGANWDKKEQGSARIPWTGNLLNVFRERAGFDLLPYLPELILQPANNRLSRARYHYRECLTHLFCDAFARQIGEWCEKEGLLFTGHLLTEEVLDAQTDVLGSSMRFYEHMQAPGMDLLTETQRIYDGAKQVSSVARQCGRMWRLSETYGVTGWDFPFLGHKALSDWQIALGINLLCPHLSWYSMQGQNKRDYPASIFFQSPWWQAYSMVTDYHARIIATMTRGEEIRDVLVVHPIESMWILYTNRDVNSPRVQALNRLPIEIRDTLLGANLDFDYGDEEMMSRLGRVARKDGQPVLMVGKAAYRVVVVPPLLTIRRSTLALLEAFRKAGGAVVFTGKPPALVDALPCPDAKALARTCEKAPAKGSRLVAAVEGKARRVSIVDGKGVEIAPALHLLREDRDAQYLFVCNTGHKRSQLKPQNDDPTRVRERTAGFAEVTIRAFDGCDAPPLELDPETGEIFTADARQEGSGWRIQTSLPPLGSRLFIAHKKKDSGQPPPKRLVFARERRHALRRECWPIQLSEPNVVVLDQPRYRIGGEGPWNGPLEILRIDHEVRAALGIEARTSSMTQPWTRPKPIDPKTILVELEYTFSVRDIPAEPLHLGLEYPETCTVSLNDRPVENTPDAGWWIDPSLRRIPMDPAGLQCGENRLRLECRYNETHTGLEIAYLLGPFSVNLKGRAVELTAPPTTLRLGDWCPQGLPFYSGNIDYLAQIRPVLKPDERLFVRVPSFRGAAVQVSVDGRAAGMIAWAPFELDITDAVHGKGQVELGLQVLGHRRNSHGPLHNTATPLWVGPGSYEHYVYPHHWTDGYNLEQVGLMKPPELITRTVLS